MTLKSLLSYTFTFGLLTAPVPSIAEEFLPLTEPVVLNPVDESQEEVGGLLFMGGLEIEPGEAKIGGISGLEWHDDKLYAVMDDGRWLVLTPDEFGAKLIDVIAAESGPLLSDKGRRLRGKTEGDAESLTRSADGSWLVAFEQDHRILSYSALDGRATSSDNPIVDLIFDAEDNGGMEALTNGPEGLFACGEWAGLEMMNCMRERGAGLVSFEVSPPQELAGRGAVPTGAACAGDGTCYVLMRSYSREQGNAAAIMSVSARNEVNTIATFLPPLTLDNFEGLAVREENGRRYLYIASDNNFSDRQRTLLMKFEIPAARNEAEVAPPPVTEPEAIYETVSVVIETEMGDITVALETERAPITAANFLRYVDEDRFDGTVFYRAMSLDREPRPNGLLQGGTQFDPKRILPGIEHEPTTKTGLSHTSGALSMAMGEPGTANGDFSIMLQDQIGLDARPESDDPVWQNGYAVFGYVTDGMDVVAAIHGSGIDPEKGEGWMKGQMLAQPVKIIDVRRLGQTTAEPATE